MPVSRVLTITLTSPDEMFHVVDANLIDADGLKLAFGSYNDGIFQIPLSDIQTLASVCAVVLSPATC